MYRMLIADDEEIERKALKMVLEDGVPELKVTAEAENGITLLKLLKEQEFDILIVDIEMPGLSGLEALQLALDDLGNTKIILYTAYSQFDYAQVAVRCHAYDYVLKPARREKMITLIEKCIRDLENERSHSMNSRQLKDVIKKIRPMLSEEIMAYLCEGVGDREKVLMYLQTLGIMEEGGCIVTFAVQTAPQDAGQPQETLLQMAGLRKALHDLREETVNIMDKVVIRIRRNEIICFIPMRDIKNEYQNRIRIIDRINVILHKAERNGNVTLSAGIGCFYEKADQMPVSYKESISALHSAKSRLPICHYKDLFSGNPNAALQVKTMEKEKKQLLEAVKNGGREELGRAIDLIFSRYKDVERSLLNDRIIEMLMDSLQELADYFPEGINSKYNISQLCTECIECRHVLELKKWCTSVMTGLMEELHKDRGMEGNDIIDRAMKYMDDNYMKDLSLEDVAEVCDVSIYYLSRLFKEQTNENYSTYLTRIRMEAAKKLVVKYNYSIKVLAEKLGFHNPGYFCKVFKNYTGCTVSEWKSKSMTGKG